MTWELDADGAYVLLAEGVDAKGNRCKEKLQRLRPVGVSCPVEGLPGLTCVTTRPNRNATRAEAKREDGSLAGEGAYTVADDGTTMVASTKGSTRSCDSSRRRRCGVACESAAAIKLEEDV
jgi:hypothetical protein